MNGLMTWNFTNFRNFMNLSAARQALQTQQHVNRRKSKRRYKNRHAG
jgi:hypothetical protein